jgi:hypothetical protein
MKPPLFTSKRSITAASPYKKKKIPKALREATWLKHCGKVFETKCRTTWCQNTMTVYDFHAGHRTPESLGGPTTITNLVPICSRCNLSMGNTYTFEEWCRFHPDQRHSPCKKHGGTPSFPQPPPPRPMNPFLRLFACLFGLPASHTHAIAPLSPVGPPSST